MNTKLEKILIFVIWYAELYVITLLFPPKDNMTWIDHTLYLVSSIIITRIIYDVYIIIRNKFMYKKILSYRNINDHEASLSYINKLNSKYNKVVWLKLERVITLALKGNISEFYSNYSTVNQAVRTEARIDIILKYKVLFDYLTGRKYDNTLSFQNSNLDNCLSLLLNRDNLDLTERKTKALTLLENDQFLYKSIAAMIISNVNHNLGDNAGATSYANQAIMYSQSSELSAVIKKRLLCLSDSDGLIGSI